MKREPHNEIDLLLRKLGKEESSAPLIDGHMDADELSAYAENALPIATRVRYSSHLADCTFCRQIVTQLSSAAGVMIAAKEAAVPERTGFKSVLSSFFSPVVMRYAVPALTLIIVTSIGLVVFRQTPQDRATKNEAVKSVAQTQTEPAAPTLEGKQYTDKVVSSTNTPEKNKSSDSEARSNEQPKQEIAENQRGQGEDDKRDQPTKRVDQDATAPAAAPAASDTVVAAAKPAESEPKEPTTADVAQRKGQPTSETAKVTATDAVNSPRKEVASPSIGGFGGGRSSGAKAKNETTRGRQAGPEREEDKKRADKDEPETRAVAGRSFRKQGSIWVDTGYTSQPTTSVARGSEQYRALIADEPEIRTIADQLSGEVIVVWKGRAYRIR